MDIITIEAFEKALPEKVRKGMNPAIVDKIRKTLSEPEMYQSYRDNLLGYTQIMKEGRFKLSNYIDAVKYVSHKLTGKTNQDAFAATFPEKIPEWTARGVDPKDQASYITAYNKTKLVVLLYEQTMIPTYILNQDLYQKALNTQAELMMNAHSEKVRCDAANSLLTHLKQPETQKVELDIGIKQDSSIAALRQATLELVAQQRQALQAGQMNAQQVAHSSLVLEGELVSD